jgi:hypothetical protein
MLTLPAFPPRRAWIWAFGIAFGLAAGVFLALLLAATRGWQWIAIAPAITGGFVFAAWIDARIIEYPYRAWNKLAREFARFGRLWVLVALYYILFIPVGWAGSLLRVSAPGSGESLWIEYQRFAENVHPRRGWVAAYFSWCRPKRNRWAVWLVPFLVLLSFLEIDQKKDTVPSNIYTLY